MFSHYNKKRSNDSDQWRFSYVICRIVVAAAEVYANNKIYKREDRHDFIVDNDKQWWTIKIKISVYAYMNWLTNCLIVISTFEFWIAHSAWDHNFILEATKNKQKMLIWSRIMRFFTIYLLLTKSDIKPFFYSHHHF